VPAGRNERRKEWVLTVFVLEEVGHNMGNISNAGVIEITLGQDAHGFAEICAAVLEIGNGLANRSNTIPGVCDGDGQTGDVGECDRLGVGLPKMIGVQRKYGEDLPLPSAMLVSRHQMALAGIEDAVE
jgi:hypothetical protein